MNPILKRFYEDSGTREAVREFFLNELREMAIERVFQKGAVSGIYEGKKTIDRAFDKLEETYGIIPKSVPKSSR